MSDTSDMPPQEHDVQWDLQHTLWFPSWNSAPVLCDYCGGNRSTGLTSKGKEICDDCINGTHDFPPVPGRRCENPSCRRPLPRRWTAVYCCLPCALDDA